MIKIAAFPDDNVTEIFLNIKSVCERLEGSGYWDHKLLAGI